MPLTGPVGEPVAIWKGAGAFHVGEKIQELHPLREVIILVPIQVSFKEDVKASWCPVLAYNATSQSALAGSGVVSEISGVRPCRLRATGARTNEGAFIQTLESEAGGLNRVVSHRMHALTDQTGVANLFSSMGKGTPCLSRVESGVDPEGSFSMLLPYPSRLRSLGR